MMRRDLSPEGRANLRNGMEACYNLFDARILRWWMELPELGSLESRIIRKAANRLWNSWRRRLEVLHAPIDGSDIEQRILWAWHVSPSPILNPIGFAKRCGTLFVIDELRRAAPLRRHQEGESVGLRSIEEFEEFEGDLPDPHNACDEPDAEPEETPEAILYWANRCTRTERIFFLLRNLPRYGENQAYLRACAESLGQANQVPSDYALSELVRFVSVERARQKKRPGKRYGTLSSKAIQGLFLPTYRPDIRSINTALSRALDRVAPGREKKGSRRNVRRSNLNE